MNLTPRQTLLLGVGAVIGLACVADPTMATNSATNTTDTGEPLACGSDAAISLTVGMCAPDFSMPNRDEVVVTLYAQRGKVALVDISAIW
jgi:hypothetical protein